MSINSLHGLRNIWGWVVARGALSVLFGVLAFVWPALSLLFLVLLFGVHALTDGVTTLVAGLRVRSADKPLWPFIVMGVLGIVTGLIAIVQPMVAAAALLTVIAVWAIVTGVLQIVAAVRLRQQIEREWMLGISGALSIVFGLFLLANPAAGALSLLWLIAGFSIAFGVLVMLLGWRLRALPEHGLASAR